MIVYNLLVHPAGAAPDAAVAAQKPAHRG